MNTSNATLETFFIIAKKVGLVKDGKYISGIPKGSEDDIKLFYKLEDKFEYPKPQAIKQWKHLQ